MKTEFYRCPICGNIILRVINSGVTPECCGQPMQKLEANTIDASHEKHVPVITRLGKGSYRVTIGAEPHPVTDEHHINFIYLATEHGGQLRYLTTGGPAEADFCDCNDPIVGAYAYCNLHGLWFADAKDGCRQQATGDWQQATGGMCGTKKCGKLMAFIAMLFPFAACTNALTVDNTPIPSIDLDRYLGKWYEIARFDHRFEKGLDNCTATYSYNDDGTVRVTNNGWTGDEWKESIGKAKTTATPALLRVSFFGPFYSDYRVLMVDEGYSVALVGGSNDKYLWILARQPQLDSVVLNSVLKEAQRRGYNTNNLIWVDQSYNIMWD
ncbi:MAG: lipocalin family protein [Paludibacteraceae bacterium]|nr:lipocalin family protein [Paludibacteraceae bacterium]